LHVTASCGCLLLEEETDKPPIDTGFVVVSSPLLATALAKIMADKEEKKPSGSSVGFMSLAEVTAATASTAAKSNILASTKDGIRPFKILPCRSVPKPVWPDTSPVVENLARVVPFNFYGPAPLILGLLIESAYLKEMLRRKQRNQLRSVSLHQRDNTPQSLIDNPVTVPGQLQQTYGQTFVRAQRLRKRLAVIRISNKQTTTVAAPAAAAAVAAEASDVDADGNTAMSIAE
jgi:hypothetical protein